VKLRKMVVGPVLFDQASGHGIITLKDPVENRVIPMVTGLWETFSIMNELNRITTARPNTYEMVSNLLDALDARVTDVIVDKFSDDVYFARIILVTPSGKKFVDARPSNALAVAVRAGAQIWVEESVFQGQAVPFDLGDGPSGEDAAPNDEGATDQLHDWLESVTPDDFAP